jgi:predicted HAD superfamily Cof-like phosphohydrolase
MQELSEARAADDIHGIIDAYADMIVVITGSIHKLGYDPNEVLAETLLEISSRKGAINSTTGKWQKDVNQDPTTLYKAVYSDCTY